jgi:hypothetical protein
VIIRGVVRYTMSVREPLINPLVLLELRNP